MDATGDIGAALTDGKRRLRVLHVGKYYAPHIGGIETHLRVLAAELRKYVDLNVIVANDGPDNARETIDEVDVSRLGTAFNVSSAPVCPQLARTIREARPDLVHLHLPNPWGVIAYLLSGHPGPVVASWHNDIIRQKVLGALFSVVSRKFMYRCRAIIVSSHNYIRSSPALSPLSDRCVVIPYGIDVRQPEAERAEQTAAIRSRFGPRIVLSAGRLVYYKGLEYLIRAMDRVDATLLIIGEGPLRPQLEREAGARPIIRRRVRFLGRVDELTPFYQASDVFALPSIGRSEGFGIVQLEAMACGKPVVNTRLESGVPFVSIDGVTGITVAPRRPDELADAINRLLYNPQLRHEYGRAALHRVSTEFTVRSMVARTLKVYLQVAGAKGSIAWRGGDAPANDGWMIAGP